MITLLILHGRACQILPKGCQLLSGFDPREPRIIHFALQSGAWLSHTLSVCLDDMVVWDEKLEAHFMEEIRVRIPPAGDSSWRKQPPKQEEPPQAT